MANTLGCDLSKLEELKLCKYAKIISYNLPVECKYKELVNIPHKGSIYQSIVFNCPIDSGTDCNCNKKCYEYKLKKDN